MTNLRVKFTERYCSQIANLMIFKVAGFESFLTLLKNKIKIKEQKNKKRNSKPLYI
jgi:hypothetical protein